MAVTAVSEPTATNATMPLESTVTIPKKTEPKWSKAIAAQLFWKVSYQNYISSVSTQLEPTVHPAQRLSSNTGILSFMRRLHEQKNLRRFRHYI
jgi:hypothetical protein